MKDTSCDSAKLAAIRARDEAALPDLKPGAVLDRRTLIRVVDELREVLRVEQQFGRAIARERDELLYKIGRARRYRDQANEATAVAMRLNDELRSELTRTGVKLEACRQECRAVIASHPEKARYDAHVAEQTGMASEADELRAKLADTIAGKVRMDDKLAEAENELLTQLSVVKTYSELTLELKKRAEAAEAKLTVVLHVLTSVRLERDGLEADVARLTESLDAARRGREAAEAHVKELEMREMGLEPTGWLEVKPEPNQRLRDLIACCNETLRDLNVEYVSYEKYRLMWNRLRAAVLKAGGA
jgi:chromosome segregation ATPase